MTKAEIIEKLSERNLQSLSKRCQMQHAMQDTIDSLAVLSEPKIGEYTKQIAISSFYYDIIKNFQTSDITVDDALQKTINKTMFSESFIKPRNPIEQGLHLYELEGYRMAILTIKKDFNL